MDQKRTKRRKTERGSIIHHTSVGIGTRTRKNTNTTVNRKKRNIEVEAATAVAQTVTVINNLCIQNTFFFIMSKANSLWLENKHKSSDYLISRNSA